MNLRHRWLQFSLKGLVTITLLMGVIFAGIGNWISSANKQAATVAWIKQNEGVVLYENETGESSTGFMVGLADIFQEEQTPSWKYIPFPEEWKSWFGPDFEWDVYYVFFHSNFMTRSDLVVDLREIAGLSQLRCLVIIANIENAHALNDLQQLKYLAISNSNPFDLNAIKNLDQLEDLSINQTEVSIALLEHLPQLKHLSLSSVFDEIDMSDLSPLKHLSELERLDLSGNDISDLSPIGHLQKLKKLSILHGELTDLSPLKELGNLEELRIIGTSGSTNFTPLQGLKKLKHLELNVISKKNFLKFNVISHNAKL